MHNFFEIKKVMPKTSFDTILGEWKQNYIILL